MSGDSVAYGEKLRQLVEKTASKKHVVAYGEPTAGSITYQQLDDSIKSRLSVINYDQICLIHIATTVQFEAFFTKGGATKHMYPQCM